jgi:hypothetical protein
LKLQHRLNLAGYLPVTYGNICAKKMISFKTAKFETESFLKTVRNALNEADLDGSNIF